MNQHTLLLIITLTTACGGGRDIGRPNAPSSPRAGAQRQDCPARLCGAYIDACGDDCERYGACVSRCTRDDCREQCAREADIDAQFAYTDGQACIAESCPVTPTGGVDLSDPCVQRECAPTEWDCREGCAALARCLSGCGLDADCEFRCRESATENDRIDFHAILSCATAVCR